MYKFDKANLITQTKILSPKMAELMGIYFVCEKVAKHLTRNEVSDKRLYLQMVKKWIKANGIIVSEYDVDLIFNTSWKLKGKKSFRNIRNKICHECSISERDYAVQYFKLYKETMLRFLDACVIKIAR